MKKDTYQKSKNKNRRIKIAISIIEKVSESVGGIFSWQVYRHIQDKYNVSVRTIQDVISELEKLGWLKRKKEGYKADIIELNEEYLRKKLRKYFVSRIFVNEK